MTSSADDKKYANDTRLYKDAVIQDGILKVFESSPIIDQIKLNEICIYGPNDKNKFGQTAVTAIGDKLAVSPNISVVDQPITPTIDFTPMVKTSTPTLDLTPFINAFTSFKNEIITAMNRPQPTPQFALSVDGRQLGTVVGRQTETGTAQNISTGYTMP
jgi:hypothetical protein